ncbi:hypothetical protein NECID01_0009 [Nematocida sp. AWRm77]|nr:hypothetical protein NECID01_0009 [Nematocida sp. AWRm77]
MYAKLFTVLCCLYRVWGSTLEIEGTAYTLEKEDEDASGVMCANVLNCRIEDSVQSIRGAFFWTEEDFSKIELTSSGTFEILLASGAAMQIRVDTAQKSPVQVKRILSPGLVGPGNTLNGLVFLCNAQ